jgi:hypothetical protein
MARFADLRGKAPKELKDLYPTERNKAVSLIAEVQRRFAGKMNFGYLDRVEMENMLKDLFEKHMRLDISVTWDVESGVNPEDSVFIPIPVINGRLDALDEMDHDRIKYEVRAGEADGIAGVMDPNTKELSEDSKRKDIL